MGSAKPEGVVEVPVDALGIVAPLVERVEVRITGWDLTDVLGPVELALPILVVRVQSNRDDATAKAIGQAVVVVPAVGAALVRVAVGADTFERLEHRLTDLVGLAEPDPTALRDEPNLDLT